MQPRYIRVGKACVVYTPHFQERARLRIGTTRIDGLLLGSIIAKSKLNQVSAFIYEGHYIYYRRQWNKLRCRMELELISITPTTVLKTFTEVQLLAS